MALVVTTVITITTSRQISLFLLFKKKLSQQLHTSIFWKKFLDNNHNHTVRCHLTTTATATATGAKIQQQQQQSRKESVNDDDDDDNDEDDEDDDDIEINNDDDSTTTNVSSSSSTTITTKSKKSMINVKFKKELASTKFTIFKPIRDCGYYGWNPMITTTKKILLYPKYKSISKLQSTTEIIRHINLQQKPNQLIPVSQLIVPQSFLSTSTTTPTNSTTNTSTNTNTTSSSSSSSSSSISNDDDNNDNSNNNNNNTAATTTTTYMNKYPYGQYDIASLYVATKYRNVNLNDIDFVFGGSTLNMLAMKDVSSTYMVCRIPTPNNKNNENTVNNQNSTDSEMKHTLLVRKNNSYQQDITAHGFQFERYVTTGNMNHHDTTTTIKNNNFEFVEHMHIMNIKCTTLNGTINYKVLFCAEVDAMDEDGNPIEIKAVNRQNSKIKELLQIISSGSTGVCHGYKDKYNQLKSIKIKSLSEVATSAMNKTTKMTYSKLEQNITHGMNEIYKQMHYNMNHNNHNTDKKNYYNNVYKVSFDQNKKLRLHHMKNIKNSILLPPTNIVQELLYSK